MRTRSLCVILVFLSTAAFAATPADNNSVVITFKDGHQQAIPLSDISRIEFKSSAPATAATSVTRGQFRGKWKCGDGMGGFFYITLETNGEAHKSIGAPHGTWSVVDGEAQISWDDGWHDAIRKQGNAYQKIAYAPGKTFSDKPENVQSAENTESR